MNIPALANSAVPIGLKVKNLKIWQSFDPAYLFFKIVLFSKTENPFIHKVCENDFQKYFFFVPPKQIIRPKEDLPCADFEFQ
jgi:hypothetical protein